MCKLTKITLLNMVSLSLQNHNNNLSCSLEKLQESLTFSYIIHIRLCAGSNYARCVSEIRDGEDLWQWSPLEIRLITFRRSTIPQKQFIIIFIIIKHLMSASLEWAPLFSLTWGALLKNSIQRGRRGRSRE